MLHANVDIGKYTDTKIARFAEVAHIVSKNWQTGTFHTVLMFRANCLRAMLL